jgi:hypothetical protein
VIVILNDNDMSISENVARSTTTSQTDVGPFLRRHAQPTEVLDRPEQMKQLAKRVEEHAKGMITPSTMFEEFGFNYTGPIDGHNVDVLIDTLTNVKRLPGPQFLHVVTNKGQAYKYAEEDPITYHGPGKFDPEVGLVKAKPSPDAKPKPTYTQVFGEWLCDMARADKRVMGITPAMREGSGLVKFSQQLPAAASMSASRAARRYFRGRSCRQRHEARGRHLLHVPQRLRPAHPRHRAAEPAGGVRDGPRRPGGRGWSNAPWRIRSFVPSLHSQHDGDGAFRRERMPADALHRVHSQHTDSRALSARQRPGRRDREGHDRARRRQGRGAPRGQARRSSLSAPCSRLRSPPATS